GGSSRVAGVSPTGTFIRQFGRPLGSGGFLYPFVLAVDQQGNAYVIDDLNDSLSKFSSVGKLEWQDEPGSPRAPDLNPSGEGGNSEGIDLDRDRGVVVADQAGVVYIDATGKETAVFHTPSEFPAPGDVRVDSQGDTVVQSFPDRDHVPSETCPGCATWLFDRDHNLIGEWNDTPLLTAPRFGPNGEIFAIAKGGVIVRLTIS